jgi:peptide chain release factor
MTKQLKPHKLLISSGNGPSECRIAVSKVITRIEKESARLGVSVETELREADPHGPSSAIITLTGKAAGQIQHAWIGSILWICKSPVRPRHGRKNWYIQIFDATQEQLSTEIKADEVDMQAIRAGGPGGQHQNKTSSAIRAQWESPEGKIYAVRVSTHRSQHQNRSEAIRRLNELVMQDAKDASSNQVSHLRQRHHEVVRGAPDRTFRGLSFKEE